MTRAVAATPDTQVARRIRTRTERRRRNSTPLGSKPVLTTGDVAQICHVAARTVSKWFDSGKLHGYRIPGSRDRRIPRECLVQFMRDHGMPLDGLDGGACKVLIVDPQVPRQLVEQMVTSGRYNVRTAEDDFAAGVAAEQFRPHVIAFDLGCGEHRAIGACENIKSNPALQAVKVIAVAESVNASRHRRLKRAGFDQVITKPYTPAGLAEAIEAVTQLGT